MPIQSKIVTIESSEDADKAYVVVLNRTSGDIWHTSLNVRTALLDIANDNIWGDEPTQWVIGDVLEIIIYGEKLGAGTVSVAEITETIITMNADTAFEIVV